MTPYKPGEVVLVRFPFSDLSTAKQRPALVISVPWLTLRYGDVIVLAMTSQPQREVKYRISQWRSAGLPKPTWFKPVIGTLASTLIRRRIGRLHAADFPRARHVLRRMVAPVFLK